jgi:putative selenate reductase
MSDLLRPQPFDVLLKRILKEYEATESIFGIHKSFFYAPRPNAPYAVDDFFGDAASGGATGQRLATPIGPSAGPHTQLSQNIVAAWLCGGRFIELKTVQIMDELEIPRPCIDMEDEGYNVEWSQELKLEESAQEYINAWAFLHILPRVLGWKALGTDGTIFDMSVGYNLQGILSPRMQEFMDKMTNAGPQLWDIKETLRRDFPQFADVDLPTRLVNSVTLSTMHGCPPDEIERIARYMLEERKLHTIVKMNPTLLGKEGVLGILHNDLGFTGIHIPDAVFEHDLQYPKALELIRSLQSAGAAHNLAFGVKLSNTLAMANHRKVMPGDEMYMSGRALYPVTMNLFDKLAHEFNGNLRVSYSAGADAINIGTILKCGAAPVTACSDLLKPGGYARFGQWLTNLEAEMDAAGAKSLDAFAANKLDNVAAAAAESLKEHRYKKEAFPYGLPKIQDDLSFFDCVQAPCIAHCAVCQDVPEYAWAIKEGNYDQALEVILARNPLPAVTGYVCNHLCQTRCTRNDYEETIAIRALKRFAEEHGKVAPLVPKASVDKKVAIIGSGPSGFSAAFYLALNGVDVHMYEAKDVIGGMMRLVPVFRLPWEVIQRDVDRILDLGVTLEMEHLVDMAPEALLDQGFDAVYVATGFQRDTPLNIPGVKDAKKGVFAALTLLDRVRRGERVDIGKKALVIGGGDTAMDAVRTSRRLTGNPTTIVYRRTRAEMPASPEEIEGALEEGNILEELVSPVRVMLDDQGSVTGLGCVRNQLGEPGPDGRRRPVVIPGSDFVIPCDSIMVAVGQTPELSFLDGSVVTLCSDGGIEIEHGTGRTQAPNVYAGGDVAEAGPESIIAACADGRRAAEAVCSQFDVPFAQPPAALPELSETDILANKQMRVQKIAQQKPPALPIELRDSFDLIELTFTEEQAQAEGARCLQCTTYCDKCVEVCPNRANMTFRMTPVHAMIPVLTLQGGSLVVAGLEPFTVDQNRQIVNINDFCNACGDCTTFCMHSGQPWFDKPRLFLNEDDFLNVDHNGYRIQGGSRGELTIRHRESGQEARLAQENGHLAYDNDQVRVILGKDYTVQAMELKQPFEGRLSLREAAAMHVVLEGISESLPHLILE